MCGVFGVRALHLGVICRRYVCACAHICACAFACAGACVHLHGHMYVCSRMCAGACVHLCECMCGRMCALVRAYVCVVSARVRVLWAARACAAAVRRRKAHHSSNTRQRFAAAVKSSLSYSHGRTVFRVAAVLQRFPHVSCMHIFLSFETQHIARDMIFLPKRQFTCK